MRKGFYLYEHGQTWRVTFYAGGRRYQKRVGPVAGNTREQAEAAARLIIERTEAQLRRSREQAAQQNPIVLYVRRLKRRDKSYAENCKRYNNRLHAFFGDDCDLSTLTRRDIERWRDWLMTEAKRNDKRPGPLSRKSVIEHIHWLAAVYNNAGMKSPCKGVELPEKKHAEAAEALEYFTSEEVAQMMEVCREKVGYFYNGFVFLLFTGCRVGEMQGIHNSPQDIDEANRIVWVTGKGSKRRPLRLTGPVTPAWDALMDQRQRYPQEDDYVFPQYETWARKGMTRLCGDTFGWRETGKIRKEKANGEKVKQRTLREPTHCGHPHMLRHTLASMALLHFKPAWDIAFLAKWLGHEDISTTYRIYGHWIAPEPPSGYSIAYQSLSTA